MRPNKQFLAYVMIWIAAWAALEILGFFFLKNRYLNDEKSLSYQHDALLGWFPEKNSKKMFQASKNILVSHNERGFRDAEPAASDKPGIVFIGDSFVWGFDVEEGQRFTDLMRAELSDWQVLNWGVSGYGTDQEYLLLQREWDRNKPQAVCLVLSGNDRMDNSSNRSYGYFKPYYENEAGALQLKGTPVPANAMFTYKNLPEPWRRSALVFIIVKVFEKMSLAVRPPASVNEDPTLGLVRAVQSFVESRGASFILATVDKDEELQGYCREEAVSCVDLSSVDSSYRFESYGSHWTPRGHAAVSRLFIELIKSRVT